MSTKSLGQINNKPFFSRFTEDRETNGKQCPNVLREGKYRPLFQDRQRYKEPFLLHLEKEPKETEQIHWLKE